MYVCIGGVSSSCVVGGVFRRRLETLCLSDGILCLSQLLRHLYIRGCSQLWGDCMCYIWILGVVSYIKKYVSLV